MLIDFFNRLATGIFPGDEGKEHQAAPQNKSFSGLSEINLVSVKLERNRREAIYETMISYLKKQREAWGCDYSDITLLFRTNTEKETMAQKLADEGIGFAEVKGRQILASEEGVSLFCLLAHLFSLQDTILPRAAILSSSYSAALSAIADKKEQILRRYAHPYGLKAMSDVLEMTRGMVPDGIVETFQEEAEIFFRSGGVNIEEFLAYIFKVRNKITVPEPAHSGRVKLATIHGTKGLEFRHVFLLWMEKSSPFPFYLDRFKCHISFNSDQSVFWNAYEGEIAESIVEAQGKEREKINREKANILYVAVTRATHSISIFVKEPRAGDATSEGDLTSKLLEIATKSSFDAEFSWDGNTASWRRDYGPEELEAATTPEEIPDVSLPAVEGAGPGFAIDRSLIAEGIRRGIERGERIHRFLRMISPEGDIPAHHELPPSDLASVTTFLSHELVAETIFRPGKVYIEQPISNRQIYGIVDRMIVGEKLVTLIDYKTGPVRDFFDAHCQQAMRYAEIIRSLFPGKAVEAFVLYVDEEQKVVKVELDDSLLQDHMTPLAKH